MSAQPVLLIFLWCCLQNVAAQAADHYSIDPNHTYSSFEYQHWGLSTQRGRFDKNTGSIELDPDSNTGSVTIEIEADSINTGSDLFDKIMRSESFFDTQQFQKITFNSTKVVFEAGQMTQLEGTLTIKDAVRPVVIDITEFHCRFMPLYLKQACGANGYTKIKRSDYNMGRYAPFVSDEVTLYFSVEGIKD